VVSNNFSFASAILWVLMVVVGGLGNRVGVIIGSAFFALFPFLIVLIGPFERFIQDTIGREPDYFTIVIGAGLAILTIIQYPGGIGEQISPITRWLGGKPFSMHPEGHEKHAHPKEPKKQGGLLAKVGLHKHDDTERPTESLAAIGRAVDRPASHDPGEVPDVWGALVGRSKDGDS
jgi:hypothetical protein